MMRRLMLLRALFCALALAGLWGCGAGSQEPAGVPPDEVQPLPAQPAPTPTFQMSEGGGSGTSGTPAPGGGKPEPTAVPQAPPLSRNGEMSYPQLVEVEKPVSVRFSLYSANNEPVSRAGDLTANSSIELPSLPDLKPQVTVKLDLGGARVTREPEDRTQPLYETINIWEWEITASTSQTITMKPRVHVEYVDAGGKAVRTYDVPWREDVTIPRSKVVSNVVVESVSTWFNANLIGLAGILLGLPGTIVSWRGLFGKAHGATAPAAG